VACHFRRSEPDIPTRPEAVRRSAARADIVAEMSWRQAYLIQINITAGNLDYLEALSSGSELNRVLDPFWQQASSLYVTDERAHSESWQYPQSRREDLVLGERSLTSTGTGRTEASGLAMVERATICLDQGVKP
jgi:hypothetical protein